ncbi:response regulator [Desulfospira joergensenii]|uniref:response regulator n=1 Tax=Desulfospira joergensenii TaxID=53329 RepID=UPI0009FD824A|nr:response regulator [Desulfospira joergensenii]
MGIRAILIDDDQLALKILAHELDRYPDIEVEGLFTDPLEALERIKKIKPDVVFLDINMPQLIGLDAASQIKDINPNTEIVFVTSHNQYAVDAFAVDALDYLVKPISENRLAKTIQKISGKTQTLDRRRNPLSQPGEILEIRCFGHFQIQWKGKPPITWRSALTRELAAFLIQNRGKKMSKERILEELWPEDNPKTSVARLYSGMHYIRKALESYNIKRDMVELSGKYFIKLGPGIKPDTALFEEAVSKIDDHTDILTLEAMENLYTGEYLEEESWLWAYPERERINNLYTRFAIRLVEKYLDLLSYEKAEILLLKAFEKNPYEEQITSLLLQIYKKTNKKAKAAKHFAAYEDVLKNELGINAEENIRRLYASIN